ncbi:Pls/PosA family non-ribosomal peptide synthetase [Streptomyces sp. NPDC049906]|uniref:Pls/PosA family non-ribosomal peptide synthetase n=1 Tax=Streptomyces sp. NPDC049906 TaxID=3155656 RepID=UPI0034137B26
MAATTPATAPQDDGRLTPPGPPAPSPCTVRPVGPLAVLTSGPAAPPRTLIDVFAASVRRHPDAPALDDGTTRLSYRALAVEVDRVRHRLARHGVHPGDRVGLRVPSGTNDLYAAVLGVLAAGAAYVPVDAEDPEGHAARVFREAGVRTVIGPGHHLPAVAVDRPGTDDRRPGRPEPDHDAWVIFTSGSTGTPKGVAVTHRAAAAFVDAEAALFLRERPLGPGDRVMAGLSVAFDASCEEMWLAWRHGACLVPASRDRVRSGADLGPWLLARGITAISTVPTLAALWPPAALARVRLLILGGEACPRELARRLAAEGREVWNTYGPTETTVVACAAPLTGTGPVRIGLPLKGWELAVVDEAEHPVPLGGTGRLVIGGAGLARYLDPVQDAERYAPLDALGWPRAYRSGDLVRADPAGLVFLGRADDQVKLGGRRIELGEVDTALTALPGVAAAATAVRTTPDGTRLLVGYLVTGPDWDRAAALARLRAALPAALVPLLVVLPELPVRTSGKVDRDALPWPPPPAPAPGASPLTGTEAWLADQWCDTLGVPVADPGEDFFALGGTSLAAARLLTRLRVRHPDAAVLDVYQRPVLRDLARHLERTRPGPTAARTVTPVPRRAGALQLLLLVLLFTLTGLRWAVALLALGNVLTRLGPYPWAPTAPWWPVIAGAVLFFTPPGRIALAAGGARLLLHGVRPGSHPRGGAVHLRLWTAERLAEHSGATALTGAWLQRYARALGARIGADADLHSLPPVTGLLRLGRGCAVESEVDLSGHWLDGDRLHLGPVRIDAGAVVGTRSLLFPGARIGKRAEVAPGSVVTGRVPAGQRWAGAPAVKRGRAKRDWPRRRPPRSPLWRAAYGATGSALLLFPLLPALPALWVAGVFVDPAAPLPDALRAVLLALVPATLAYGLGQMLLLVTAVRLLGLGLRTGVHPAHSRIGWQAWTVTQLMDLARTALFPLYAGLVTPVWLRLLGMRVGRGAEVSTVLALPSLTTVGDGAFLADDTLAAPFRLGGGWVRIGRARIGRRAFLGNSGMTAPGRRVPDGGLVGVLSATPKKAKKGSSYLGSPPVRLPRATTPADRGRTYEPTPALRCARALVELCRLVPVLCSAACVVLTLAGLSALAAALGPWAAALGGLLLLAAGALACTIAILAKWLLVKRHRSARHPLWSGYVWRNELADTFVEVLAVPWLVGSVPGTPLLAWWLRALGARIGRGTWCESYWLPEPDLVTLGPAVTVGRGCVLQTHLFHDRVLRTDRVELRTGATLGPNGIVLPGATVGAGTTLGPGSLVMAGESVPAGTRWLGNPIEAWRP